MFTEQILIFQEGIIVLRTNNNFPGNVFSARRTDTIFSRKICLFIEQIPIFQEQSFFGNRTDTDIPGAPFWLPNGYRFSRNTFLVTE